MQVCLRPRSASGIDHELLWLSVSLGGLAAAATWFALGLPWPHCIFFSITGFPCVTCGATRATIQFLHGNFLAAWKWNPLVLIFLSGLTLFNVYAAAVLATRAPRLRLGGLSSVEKKAARGFVIVLLALNWIYLLARSTH
jgi:hypothetical protein